MAIYKPTDCSPFNGTFDATADKPIIFECKVDTSNTKVTGYTIEIYDSDTNQKVFPDSSTDNKLKNRITYLPDLKTYVSNKFPSVVLGIGNANTGLNGTYIEIPFYVEQVAKDSTVGRNQMSSKLENGKTYLWKITLYQEITKNGDSVTLPTELKYYDMTNRENMNINIENLTKKWFFSTNNKSGTRRFGDYFQVSHAVATLDNKAFLLTDYEEDDNYIYVGNYKIEKEITRPAVSVKSKRYKNNT